MVHSDKIRKDHETPSSCNYAEYLGLNLALSWLSLKEFSSVTIYGDSLMVIKQMSGQYKIKPGKLYSELGLLTREKKDALKTKGSLSFKWIPRERNKEADLLTS